MNPLNIGTEHDFSIARNLLEQARYTTEELCRRFGLASLGDFEDDYHREQVEPWHDSALGVLLRLFMELRHANAAAVRRHFSDEQISALANLGLAAEQDGRFLGSVGLYPIADLWIASDRWLEADRSAFVPPPDIVYSSFVSNAQRFLGFLPQTPAEKFLDLCTGSGAAALLSVKHFSTRAHAVDITPRSAEFSEFNRRLNGLENVLVGCGDLYEPVRGEKFDRIVAHPPYVPVLRPNYIFHDGGEDGESIVRRIVQGIPQHLQPGGLAYVLTMLSDREEGSAEQRVRSWLGTAEAEFDIGFFPVWTKSAEDYAVTVAANSHTPEQDQAGYQAIFDQLKIRRLVYGFVQIVRRSEEGKSFTVRRQTSSSTVSDDLLQVMRVETLRNNAGAGPEMILGSIVSANPSARLNVQHVLTENGWTADAHKLTCAEPFLMEANVELWGAYLISLCDGERTVREVLETLQEEDLLPDHADPLAFANAVAILASGGFLTLKPYTCT